MLFIQLMTTMVLITDVKNVHIKIKTLKTLRKRDRNLKKNVVNVE